MVSGAPSSRDSSLPIQFPSNLAAADLNPRRVAPQALFEFWRLVIQTRSVRPSQILNAGLDTPKVLYILCCTTRNR